MTYLEKQNLAIIAGDLGVRKIVFKNGGKVLSACGATKVGIFLVNKYGETVLKAKQMSEFGYGETITWTRVCRDDRDDKCLKPYRNFRRHNSPKFDDTFTVQIKTVAGQFFCPVQAHIELDDGYTYITRFTNGDNGWYSQTTNNIDHPVQVLWTPKGNLHLSLCTVTNCRIAGLGECYYNLILILFAKA